MDINSQITGAVLTVNWIISLLFTLEGYQVDV